MAHDWSRQTIGPLDRSVQVQTCDSASWAILGRTEKLIILFVCRFFIYQIILAIFRTVFVHTDFSHLQSVFIDNFHWLSTYWTSHNSYPLSLRSAVIYVRYTPSGNTFIGIVGSIASQISANGPYANVLVGLHGVCRFITHNRPVHWMVWNTLHPQLELVTHSHKHIRICAYVKERAVLHDAQHVDVRPER